MRIPVMPLLGYAAVVAGSMTVAGCDQTKWSGFITGEVSERGAAASDQTMKNLHWGTCDAISVGAVRRRYVGTTDWPAYAAFCGWPQEYINITTTAPRSLLPQAGQ